MTQKKRLIELLSDGKFHDNRELAVNVALAFNQRLNEMKRDGEIDFETKRDEGNQAHVWYRLKPKYETQVEAGGQIKFA